MSEEWITIKKVLENPDYKWRTINGIVKETGLDRMTVVNNIKANEHLIVKSSIPSKDGSNLFTTREHYRILSTPWERIASAITNKVEI